MIESKYFKEISHYLRPANENKFVSIYQYILNCSTIDKCTVVLLNIFVMSQNYTKIDLDLLILEMKDILKIYEFHINSSIDEFSYNVESIMIKAERTKIWSLVSDWEIFRLKIEEIAENVEYHGGKKVPGSILVLKWDSKGVTVVLKILEISDFHERDDWKLILELSDSQPKMNRQFLSFSLKYVSKEVSLLMFKHEYLEPLDLKSEEILIKKKRTILSKLKKIMESH